ncbi:MAG: nucleotide-binding protein [Candidatus Bathyarchaeota archaeon]|nr:nucleotide-binding protein [Candidatus Bathyarchaeota archaeon]
MKGNLIKVPVEYTITTTSDWTQLEIINGGFWDDLQIIYFQGEKELSEEIVSTRTSIFIHKEPYNEKLVVVSIKCTLCIPKEKQSSNLRYRITKGDIESTIVEVTINGKKGQTFVNSIKQPNDEKNPLIFDSPSNQYLQSIKDKVFIIHGKDDRQALYLQKYLKREHNVDAIIFDDISDEGKTIIEQIEYIRDNVFCAIAIVTADDVGCLNENEDDVPIGRRKNASKETGNKIAEKLQGRARQNVVFELGLFIGALGRKKVCYLKQKNVMDTPSDLNGVLYKEFEKEAREVFHELPSEIFRNN